MRNQIVCWILSLAGLLSAPKVLAQSNWTESETIIINTEDSVIISNILASYIDWQSYRIDYVKFSEPHLQSSSPLFELNLDFDANLQETTNYDLSKWSFTLWGGLMTNNDLAEGLTGSNLTLEDSQLLGIGINRKIAETKRLKLEGEFQLLNHSGKQSHLEATVALVLRWIVFSRFNLAVIEGLSYATDTPRIEDERNTPETHFLNYLAFEAEYSYTPEWSFSARLHHRSGVGGLFGGVYGGSNAYILGIRRRF